MKLAPLYSPPPTKADHLFLAWGIDPDASRFALADFMAAYGGTTLEQRGSLPQGDVLKPIFNALFYLAHHVDLHNKLKMMAT